MSYQTNFTGEELGKGWAVLSSPEAKQGWSSLSFNALKDNFIDVVQNHYWCFEGTAGRTAFWQFVLVLIPIWIAVLVLTSILAVIGLASICGIIPAIVILALAAPTCGLAARRLHEAGKSGWLQVIPVVGLILCLLPKSECSCGCGCGCEQK